VPARILLVFPSIQTVYLIQSEKYFSDIHKLYHDSASRNTKNWKKQSQNTKRHSIPNYCFYVYNPS
jgi:hypothetical protein